ncbi:hypothetical protein KIN20_011471 [Parelaphostrongylus tenuis]|uniref:Uncharacterized protein n=1 Tax=Parelaphostrongylus tenuis TaxID=148309 RepID=A0AAD5MAY1_PARTN|nr:hypothetical protein KIN20_011471 [Parelaphostrongylus tenuis]
MLPILAAVDAVEVARAADRTVTKEMSLDITMGMIRSKAHHKLLRLLSAIGPKWPLGVYLTIKSDSNYDDSSGLSLKLHDHARGPILSSNRSLRKVCKNACSFYKTFDVDVEILAPTLTMCALFMRTALILRLTSETVAVSEHAPVKMW